MLDWTVVPEFFLFTIVLTIVPGGNNMLTFLHVVRSGLREALIFRAGVLFGFPLMGVAVLLFLSPILKTYPIAVDILTYVSFGLLVFLAYQIWSSSPDLSGRNKPLLVRGFWRTVLFQWVNGKAWALSLTAVGLYTTPTKPLFTQAFTIWFMFLFCCVLVSFPWIGGALFLRQWLIESSRRLAIFNKIMAVVIVAVAVKAL